MIKINLLPPEYAAEQARKEQRLLAGMAGGIVGVVLLAFWLFEAQRASAWEKRVTEAEAELKKFQVIMAQIEQIESDKQRKTAKLNVIKNLNRSRLLYPVLLEDLLPLIPADVWITNMTISEQGEQLKLTLTSSALSNFALATWLSNLQQSTHFAQVELGPIAYVNNSEQGTSVLTFAINCFYHHKGPMPLSEGAAGDQV